MPSPLLDDSSESASASFWQVVIAAIRGEHRDYTTETLNRAVVLLAIPMVLEMVMESIFALADVFWVSHLGSDAVAVVGGPGDFIRSIRVGYIGTTRSFVWTGHSAQHGRERTCR